MKKLQTQKKLQSFMKIWNTDIVKQHWMSKYSAYFQGNEIIIENISKDDPVWISPVLVKAVALIAYSLELYIDPYPLGLRTKGCLIIKDI